MLRIMPQFSDKTKRTLTCKITGTKPITLSCTFAAGCGTATGKYKSTTGSGQPTSDTFSMTHT
ncbi:MAG: hypothetical protein ABSH20_26420 [Tepidisphaeraceae bacterium]|jgi:hypothetical protein